MKLNNFALGFAITADIPVNTITFIPWNIVLTLDYKSDFNTLAVTFNNGSESKTFEMDPGYNHNSLLYAFRRYYSKKVKTNV